MCLYPTLIRNRKYVPNKKNEGNPPEITDERTLYVPIGCGNCMECRKQKAREWQVRLSEELKTNKKAYFITYTFSTEALQKHTAIVLTNIQEQREKLTKCLKETQLNTTLQKLEYQSAGYGLDNAIATTAVRMYLERYRKHKGRSLRHWLVTELGHQRTEHLHLHGIIWTDDLELACKTWQNGFIWKGNNKNNNIQNYVNEQTINYIIKYVTKIDNDHRSYKPIILASPGIGRHFIDSTNAELRKYRDTETNETYKTRSGHKIALPIYYRNHLYTDEQREKLWLNKLDKGKRYILGTEIDVNTDLKNYMAALKAAQQRNKELGYGTNEKNWNATQYEQQHREMIQSKRYFK